MRVPQIERDTMKRKKVIIKGLYFGGVGLGNRSP